MLYQICTLSHAQGEKKPFVTSVKTVYADGLADAYAHATTIYGNNVDIIVYPYCTASDGNAQTELARYTVRSYEKWERRNNSAVMNPFNRGYHDREDYISIAVLAINTLFASNPNANMHDLKTFAFSAISREQTRQGRLSEREYHPGWNMHNMEPRQAKATYPKLCKLISHAVENADITEYQMEILLAFYADQKPVQDMAKEYGISRTAVYKIIYKCYLKILEYAVECDPEMKTFIESGISIDDVKEEIEKNKKRTEKTKKKKKTNK